MNTHGKIIIDRLFGNFLLRSLALFSKIKSGKSETKNIVVCKFLGMGSILQSTPLLSSLKQNFPKAKITFVTSEKNLGLLEMIPMVDRIITVNDTNLISLASDSIYIIREIRKLKASHFFDLEPHSFFSKIICLLSSAKFRLGFKKETQSLPAELYTHVIPFFEGVNLSESYLNMGVKGGCISLTKELYAFPSDKIELNDEKYIVINVNASDLRIERRWPPEFFAQLMENLSEQFPHLNIKLTGNNSEAPYVENVIRLMKHGNKNVESLAGKKNLNELFELIRHCKLMITNDTGPLHIASCLQTPVIALFGPAAPAQYTIPQSVTVIYRKVPCSPCVHLSVTPPCRGNNICMKEISPEEVEKVASKVLSDLFRQ